MRPDLRVLGLGADAAAWGRCGFTVAGGGLVTVGDVTIMIGAGGRPGLNAWGFSPQPDAAVDGIPLVAAPVPAPPVAHPCGAVAIDHVVVVSPDPDRTLAALRTIGCELRAEQSGEHRGTRVRRLFLPLPQALLEVVGPAAPAAGSGSEPAALWGLTFVTPDIGATASRLGPRAGPVRPAVQSGRRITAVGPDAGLGTRVAFMSPRGRRGAPSDAPDC